MSMNDSFLKLRNEINNIDEKIINLLAKRNTCILKITQSKIENNQKIRDKIREKELLKKVIKLGKKHSLNSQYINELFQLIIKESILNQQALVHKLDNYDQLHECYFAFLGPKGSYSHIALNQYTHRYYIKSFNKECNTFEEIIDTVNNNQAQYAILPIENNSSGAIEETLNILEKNNLYIVGEVNIDINHCLLVIKNTKLNNIKTIYSHYQPFKQCSQFINKLPKIEIKYVNSTADAMKKVAKYNNTNNAALGSSTGGQRYNLDILASNLANQEKNITRFVVLSKNKINISNQISSKTSILFYIKHQSDEIVKILSILKENNLIIRHLVIKKINTPVLEKILYIDIYKNISSVLLQKILKKINDMNVNNKILGCYPTENIIPVTL